MLPNFTGGLTPLGWPSELQKGNALKTEKQLFSFSLELGLKGTSERMAGKRLLTSKVRAQLPTRGRRGRAPGGEPRISAIRHLRHLSHTVLLLLSLVTLLLKSQFSVVQRVSTAAKVCGPHPLPARRETHRLPSHYNQGLRGDT